MRMTPRWPRPARLTRLVCALALVASAIGLGRPPAAHAATFTVTKTSDSKDGVCDRDCSLREAIIAAHRSAGTDTITLPAGTYLLTLSDLDITSNLSIVGAGAATTIIDGNARDRVFEVRPDITVTLDKITVRNGYLGTGNAAGILNDGTLTLSNSAVSDNIGDVNVEGVGIVNHGTLTLNHTTVSGNHTDEGAIGGILNTGTLNVIDSTISHNGAWAGGGGINNSGTLTITRSTISHNGLLPGYGGGILNSGTATISDSTISDNYALGGAGGIGNGGTMTITNSTINGNQTEDDGADGGGIDNGGWLSLVNTTVSGNEVDSYGSGGGISNSGTLFLRNSTIVGNAVTAGIGGLGSSSTSPVTISNTIIAGNISYQGTSPDCGGTLQSQGYNLIGNTNGCTISGTTTGNRLNIDPQLGPLQNNGGPTLTHLPASTSPAIDRGSPATPGSGDPACPAADQRGTTRPRDGNGDGTARCDIGAVER